MTSQLCNRPTLKNMVCVCLCGETFRKMDDDASLNVLHFSWMVFYDCGAGRSKSHNIPEDAIFNLRDLEKEKEKSKP